MAAGEIEWVRGRARNLFDMDLPEWREVDAWVMRVRKEIVGPMGAGSQLDVLRYRCAGAGLDEAQTLEVWERVSLLEGMFRG